MKYQIKIDRNSIEKNPKAGFRGPYFVPGILQTEIIDGKIHQTREVNSFYTISGQAKYFFDYLPCEVQCDYCGEKFDHSLLESEWREIPSCYEEDYYFNDTYEADYICPFCKQDDCCELERENIEEVIKED
jgi:hypothetical protein